MLKKVSNEMKVGSVTAVAITILILGYNFMVGKDNPLSSSRELFVKYDSTLGIAVSAPVMFNGLKIGQLKKLELDDDSKKILAKIEIFGNLKIPTNSRLKIESAILGSPSIKLLLGNSSKYAEDGDFLLPDYSINIMSSVNEKIDPIAQKADSVLASINALISRKSLLVSLDYLPTLLKSVEVTIATMQQSVNSIDPTLKNVEKFSNDLQQYSASLKTSLAHFEGISKDIDNVNIDQITKSLQATITSLNTFAEKINSGDGTLAMLANDKALYDNLARTTDNLNKLTLDLQKFPEKYVPVPFTKKQRKTAKQNSDDFFETLPDSMQ